MEDAMGTYTGTSGDDNMSRFGVSAGVVSVPLGSVPSDAPDTLSGLDGNDSLNGEGGDDTLNGGTGDDGLEGSSGDDTLFGETGNDWMWGGDGNDHMESGGGNDTLYGGTGNDHMESGGGNDTLYGETGNDRMWGGDGTDRLYGGTGDDVMNGGAGTDTLNGESGDDIYDFDATSDSAFGASRDIIENFDFEGVDTGDRIDVSTIDANVDLAGNQAFTFIGTAPLTEAGQISVYDDTATGNTVIQLNTNNDVNPESEIAIEDFSVLASSYTALDFNLGKFNLLENGSFEMGPEPGFYLPLNPGSKDINGWEVIRGGIDYIGTAWVASDGNRSLDLNGTPGIGGVAQTFDTIPNQNYHVSFDLAGHDSGLLQQMRVSAAGQSADFSFQSGTDPNNLGWQEQTWDFTATDSQTTLEFYSLQTAYPYGGPALDDVMVTAGATHDGLWPYL